MPEAGVLPATHTRASDIPMSAKVAALVVIFLGYFFYCYNWVIIDYVRPYLVDNMGMTLQETALLYTSESLGALIGSLLTAWLVTHWGNKKTLVFITAMNGVVTVANLLLEGFMPWLVMRFILGLSLGGYFVVAVGFFVLLCPPKYRSRLEALNASAFAIAVMSQGALGGLLGDEGWLSLMWLGGVPPIIVAFTMLFLVPNDKTIIGYGESIESAHITPRKGRWSEMFREHYGKLTVMCLLVAGMNFMAYQFFAAFITAYLKTERGFDAAAMGTVVAAQGIGSFIGGLFWAHIADTYGRRYPAIGFLLSAVLICLYFLVPAEPWLLAAIVFGYGFNVSCTYAWGVYFAELFPPHLKAMGASLFHGGRIISMLSPSLVAVVAESYSLAAGMLMAPVVLLLATVIWFRLPETLTTSRGYRGHGTSSSVSMS